MANKQLADDLRAARKVIEKPEAWIKGSFAMDECGNEVEAESPAACRFCVRGAIYRAVPERYEMTHGALWAQVGDDPLFDPLVKLNDSKSTTHADILALFDRAIAAAEAS